MPQQQTSAPISSQQQHRRVFDGTTWILGLLLIGVVCLQLYFGSRLDAQSRIVEQWELELIESEAIHSEISRAESKIEDDDKNEKHPLKKTVPKKPLPPPHRHRIAMVIPYIGKRLPAFFRIFAASCQKSAELVDFLIFLNDQDAVPKEKDAIPSNIKFVVLGRHRFARLHARAALVAMNEKQNALNISEEDRLTELIERTFERNPRQLVEFKPAIGVIFNDYLKEYTHWAFGDLDLLVGDIGTIALESELNEFDVITYSFGDQWRAYPRGQWTVHRNIRRVNLAYGSYCSYLTNQLATRLQNERHYESTEGCYSFALRRARIYTKFAVTALTDATKTKDLTFYIDGEVRACRAPDQVAAYESADCRPLAPLAWGTRDRMQMRVNDRRKKYAWQPVSMTKEKMRCMGWVNPRYQPCLDWPVTKNGSHNAAQNYELVLYANGTYARQYGTQDDFVRLDAAYRVWAFFHFQEWKKKFFSFSAQLPGTDGGYDFRDFILQADTNYNILRRVPRPITQANLVVTKYGFLPIPASRPQEPYNGARLRQDVDDAVPLARIPRHYCAFKACGGQKHFIERADFSLLFPLEHDQDTDDDLLRDSLAEWWRPRFNKEAGVSLAFAAKREENTEDSLVSNACAWQGPLVAVLVSSKDNTGGGLPQHLISSLRACRRQQTDKSTLILGMRVQHMNANFGLKAALNAALDATRTRFALALRNAELVSPGAYKAIVKTLKSLRGNGPSAPRGTTLILPEFFLSPKAGLFPASITTGCGAAPALSDAAYMAWSAFSPSENNYTLSEINKQPFRKSLDAPLSRLDAAPVLVLDALDDRGDRRLVRELEELGGPGCYDAAFLRSLRLHHAANTTNDQFISLVPGAFVFSRINQTNSSSCNCPIQTSVIASTLKSYAAFLEIALDLRVLADEESRLRYWDARRSTSLSKKNENKKQPQQQRHRSSSSMLLRGHHNISKLRNNLKHKDTTTSIISMEKKKLERRQVAR